jgi:hypothetical protein
MSFTPAQDGQSTSLDTGIKEGRKGFFAQLQKPLPLYSGIERRLLKPRQQGLLLRTCGLATPYRPVGLPIPKECHPRSQRVYLVVRPPCAAYTATTFESPYGLDMPLWPMGAPGARRGLRRIDILRSPGPSRMVLGTTTSAGGLPCAGGAGCGPHFGKILPTMYYHGPWAMGYLGYRYVGCNLPCVTTEHPMSCVLHPMGHGCPAQPNRILARASHNSAISI